MKFDFRQNIFNMDLSKPSLSWNFLILWYTNLQLEITINKTTKAWIAIFRHNMFYFLNYILYTTQLAIYLFNEVSQFLLRISSRSKVKVLVLVGNTRLYSCEWYSITALFIRIQSWNKDHHPNRVLEILNRYSIFWLQ